MKRRLLGHPTILIVFLLAASASGAFLRAAEPARLADLEKQFHTLPAEARRMTGPLFWLHGDESAERLRTYLEKVAEGGNGCFTAESRPHNDWLGPNWFRDLGICLEQAKRLGLEMWIFDEKWWPSGEVAGKVPQRFGSKYMDVAVTKVAGEKPLSLQVPTEKLIAVLAGRDVDGAIDGDTLLDLTSRVQDGQLSWIAPGDRWQVLVFTWHYSDGRSGRLLVDGASQEAVNWYINTVYQPHFDHFGADFGKTIKGYFYDEPETPGDWGTEVIPELKRRNVDWKKTLVAWKMKLADRDQQLAARYQYLDSFAEAWGRTMYGGITEWCHQHRVKSIGHWLEHRHEYLNPRLCAGNMFQLQKYSDMGAIDAVFKQFVPGKKDDNTYQTPKLGSSISHAYGKPNDVTMVEIFGARGQDLSYPEMKWWTDLMQVAGVNFFIPHSFNPRSPYDRDCPPYFYNGGFEPRWPLYRVFADYTARLSLMLKGGHHVCPVALLYLGTSNYVGKSITPEDMTTALQDALIDCDWLPYDVFEQKTKVAGDQLHLRAERYRVLVVPATEVIPFPTLAKVKSFFESGGVVIGYGILPSHSATLGKTTADITALRRAIWGDVTTASRASCKINAAGGHAYFLPAKPTARQMQQVLIHDAGIHPSLEVLSGTTDEWLHVLHRVKAGADVMLVCNQQYEGDAKQFRLRAHASGHPEIWDAMRNEIRPLAVDRVDQNTVDFDLTLEPLESVLLVFRPEQQMPARQASSKSNAAENSIALTRLPVPAHMIIPNMPPQEAPAESPLQGCSWVWYPEQHAEQLAAPGTRYFRHKITLPARSQVHTAELHVAADNACTVFVNGKQLGGNDSWQSARRLDLKPALQPGDNVLAISASNATDAPNPAGLIGCYKITFADAPTISGRIDKHWRATDRKVSGWTTAACDDTAWQPAIELVKLGGGPWGDLTGRRRLTRSPVTSNPFNGRFTLPDDWTRGKRRCFVEADAIDPERAAAVTVNGHFAGGFIGRPFRLDITKRVRAGINSLQIQPFAPRTVHIVLRDE